MKKNQTRILAWSLCTIAVVGGVARIVAWISGLPDDSTLFDAVQALGWGFAMPVVFSVLAALIVSRQARNRVGWMLMGIAVALVLPTQQNSGEDLESA